MQTQPTPGYKPQTLTLSRNVTTTVKEELNLPAFFKQECSPMNLTTKYFAFLENGERMAVYGPDSEYPVIEDCAPEDMPEDVNPIEASEFLAAYYMADAYFDRISDLIQKSFKVPSVEAMPVTVHSLKG